MNALYWLVLGALATWRLAHLLYAEDGPWNALVRLRALAGASLWGALMDCFYCLSLWIALPIAIGAGNGWLDRLLLWPALSGSAILLERAIPERTALLHPDGIPTGAPGEEESACVAAETDSSNGRPWRPRPGDPG